MNLHLCHIHSSELHNTNVSCAFMIVLFYIEEEHDNVIKYPKQCSSMHVKIIDQCTS